MSTGRTAAAAIVGWSAMGVLFALPELQTGAPWPPVLKNSLAAWWAWGLVALLMAALDRRLPLTERQLGWRLAWHVPAGVVLTIFHAYAAAAVAALLGTRPLAGVFHWGILIRGLQGMMLWSLLVYWLILGGWLAKQYYQRYLSSELRLARLERLSTEARMHALRLQLDPHFLFNALNTISSQVENDPKLARAMIEHLGDLLRANLDHNQAQHVPLDSELEFLEHYLAIQRIRFGDRLRFEQSVAADARTALVPAMTIQPLVENAIRHGISPRASGGTVRVTAESRAKDLWIRVEDDGAGLPDAGFAEGLGLSVTRQRLDGFYPNGQSSLAVRNRPRGGGVEVELRIPLLYAAGAASE
ncbi:MAG: histidine kinase [Bryobacterales bacterium]|nr:histidine kinase [Bryobacterales bacterium]